MTEAGHQAENITPPTASATPGEGVTAISTSTSASTVDLFRGDGDPYTGYFDRYITFMSCGADCYILFDDDSTNGINEATTHASNLTTATTEAIPWLLKDGVPQSFRLDRNTHRYIHLKAASGTPTVRFYPSSHKLYSK